MKRLASLKFSRFVICLMMIALVLCGCGGENSVGMTTFITPDGKTILPGEAAGDIEARFGEPVNFSEATSCYAQGNDKVYEYNGYTIYTYPNKTDGADFISAVVVTSGDIAVKDGVCIGSSFDDAVKAYGDGYVTRGTSRIYVDDEGRTLVISVDDSEVISGIEYRFE